MKEATVMHAGSGSDIQKLGPDQATARGHKSVEDLLLLTYGAEDTAAGSKDTQREEQRKERNASDNQERNADRDITVDTEGTGDRQASSRAGRAEWNSADRDHIVEQERLQDLVQDSAGRQERADENLEGAERQASEDKGSEAVKEAQVCLMSPGCLAAYSRRVGGVAPEEG